MRKAEYAALADHLKQSRADKLKKTPHAFHDGQLKALETAARWCADNLSVDKQAFLKACGIE